MNRMALIQAVLAKHRLIRPHPYRCTCGAWSATVQTYPPAAQAEFERHQADQIDFAIDRWLVQEDSVV